MKKPEEILEKAAGVAAEKAKETVKAAEKAAEKKEEELKGGELEKVAGAGDPFDKIPRTEPGPIDEELRNNG